MTAVELRGRFTLTVPEAGKCLGLGRDASYAAAERHELPAIRVGRRLVVPTHRLLGEVLGLSPELIARALGLDPEHVEGAPSQDAPTTTDSHDDLTATGAPDECASPQLSQSNNVRHLPGR